MALLISTLYELRGNLMFARGASLNGTLLWGSVLVRPGYLISAMCSKIVIDEVMRLTNTPIL
jgi:hypothetical protein